MNHIVALSGGKDSTAMALRLREIEPDTDFRFVITPTGAELPPMEAHWRKLEGLLGKPLTVVSPGYSLMDLCRKQKMIPNFRARFCTRMLKIIPYLAWLQNQFPAVSYVGLRADEEGRTGMETDDLGLLLQTRFPLREWGWGICEVLGYLDKRGVTVPDRTDCDRCYHQTLHEWWVLWREYPERWASAVEDEERTRHTYRSEQRDTWPASLRELAKAFEERGEPKQRNRDRDTECKACRI
ncbi:MAG: phosphoadenosine phosphosulfate reductase family protein [Kiritimatiellales bacterium]|nr:phosphoadenosine phosphosulfate reductase family protein [Kiritimatiellales bacterium]